MASVTNDRCGVENFVETELRWERVGALQAVNDSAGNVGRSSDHNEDSCGQIVHPHGRDETNSGDSNTDVDRDEKPAWRTDPDESENHAQDGACPNDAQKPPRRWWVQEQNCERCVRSGRDEENICVVEPAQQDAHADTPRTSVVHGGCAKEHHTRDGENCGG